jgi:hypothetical protein
MSGEDPNEVSTLSVVQEGDVELGTTADAEKPGGSFVIQPSVIDLKPKDFWFYFTLFYEEVIITDDMPNLVEYLCPYDPDEIISPWTYMWMSIIITLRGVSQVYLCAHPVAAIFICIGNDVSLSPQLLSLSEYLPTRSSRHIVRSTPCLCADRKCCV